MEILYCHNQQVSKWKTTTLESLHLSRAQILWGMYHNKTVDYVYLLWEDLMYQVENKNSKKNNDMDDFMFTTIRVISKHQETQVYSAILPQHLTNQAMLESESNKTYLAYATSEKIPKPKYVKNKVDSESSPKKKTVTTAKGKRLKTSAKAAKPAKKKQHAKTSKAKGLTVLSKVALTEEEQMKLAIKRSLIETHSSHVSGSGVDEGTGSKPGVPDVLTYGFDDEQISWKSNDKEDDDEVGLNDDDDHNDDDDDNDDDEDNDYDDDDIDNQDDDDQEDDGQDDEDQDDVNE
ncbi:retrovirus-related pol polyprotein from transposon TNT 1-94 [Tanacetum coccineum]